MSVANTLVSGALYYIGNAAVNSTWTLYMDDTIINDLGVGPMNNGLTRWNLTQPEEGNGMWTIREAYTSSGFYLGYSDPDANTPIEPVSGEIYWDIWKANPPQPGHYQFYVPHTYLTATLALRSESDPEKVDPVYLTNAYAANENAYLTQNWVITNL